MTAEMHRTVFRKSGIRLGLHVLIWTCPCCGQNNRREGTDALATYVMELNANFCTVCGSHSTRDEILLGRTK